MKYEYDDIIRLQLPDDRLLEFFKLVMVAAGSSINPGFDPEFFGKQEGGYAGGMNSILDRLQRDDYKNRPGYLLGSCNRDRAIAAMQGPSETCKQNILDLWLGVVDKMSPVEKALEGWNKV